MHAQSYRVTLRYGGARQYHIIDVAAPTLRAALVRLLEEYPEAAADADLLELRLQVDPRERVYAPE